MKIKTSELQGAALDWAVAKCEGVFEVGGSPSNEPLYFFQIGYTPSTNWTQGGPIIERENMAVLRHCGEWVAQISGCAMQYADKPLIAAMRYYVASKLGDEVEIPEELC